MDANWFARHLRVTVMMGLIAVALSTVFRTWPIIGGTALGVVISAANVWAMGKNAAQGPVRAMSPRYVLLLVTLAFCAFVLPISAVALILGYLVFIPAAVLVALGDGISEDAHG